MEASQVIHSVGGILSCIPFDRPETRERFVIETDKLNNTPFHIRRYFNISFIYTNKVRFDACCVLQKTISVYTIIIIINKKYETDYQRQEAVGNFPSRDYKSVCRRRELYCHETCHLIAITRAFPADQTLSSAKIFFKEIFQKYIRKTNIESLEKKFFQKTKGNLTKVLDTLKTSLTYNIPLSFNDFEDVPSEFDRDHFPYTGDDLNYFKLFSELMISDKQLIKHMKKIPEYKRDGKILVKDGIIDWERCFRDLLHVELSYILKKTPEKRHLIFQNIPRGL